MFMVRRWNRTFAWKARGRNAELQPLNRSIVPALFPTDQTFEEFLAWCDHEIAEARCRGTELEGFEKHCMNNRSASMQGLGLAH